MFPIIRDFLPSDIGPAVRLLEECRGLPDTKSVDIAQFVNDVSSGAPGVVAIESERIVGIVFYIQTLQDLSARRDLRVYLGDPYQFATDHAVAVTFAPVPSFKKFKNLAEVYPFPWLRMPHAGSVKSFSSWRKKLAKDQ